MSVPSGNFHASLHGGFVGCASVFLLLCCVTFGSTVPRPTQDHDSQEQILHQIKTLFPGILELFDELDEDSGEHEEAIEFARELLEEYDQILDERGSRAARLWAELVVNERQLEHLIWQAEEGEGDESVLRRKILQLVDAEIAFESTELKLMDDPDERRRFKNELRERRRNREAEADEALADILREIAGEGDEEQELTRQIESIAGKRADYKPVQPVSVSENDISEAGAWSFETKVKPVFDSACLSCHGDGSSEGNLDLEELLQQTPLVKNRDRWDNVIAQIENRTMPPPDSGSISDADRVIMAAWIRNRIERFDYSKINDPGFEPAKRLTNEEYNNTVRDLIGIDLRPGDRLPTEMTSSNGFDNSSNTLFFHENLLEKYVGLAEYIVQSAFPLKKRTHEQDEAWNQLFVVKPGQTLSARDAAEQIFEQYLPRAFRGPVDQGEVESWVLQFDRYRASGLTFEESILGCVQSTLVSPRFLMRVESTHSEDSAFQLTDHDLANRLSYFIWASMPDEELFRLANEGQLADQKVLEAQVNRMLRDPRSITLGEVFAAQWLGYEHLGSRIRLDPIDNPWCTDSLMDAMKSESAMSFVHLLRENRKLHELIDADYTFVNQELAEYYDLPAVSGSKMRKVKLDTDIRGGIFGQASLLAVTSFPDRTSPVMRGTWILTNVLGKRPPSPPPNASQLDGEIEDREFLTQRMKMELHRRNPNCAACHDQIDPLGFSLENYDLFGKYRTRFHDQPIDASGKLPDGTTFDGPAGLKKVIIGKRLDDVLVQLTRKMLAYALGRQLEYYDEAAVLKLVDAVKADDYRLRALVHGVTKSLPFQYKQVKRSQ